MLWSWQNETEGFNNLSVLFWKSGPFYTTCRPRRVMINLFASWGIRFYFNTTIFSKDIFAFRVVAFAQCDEWICDAKPHFPQLDLRSHCLLGCLLWLVSSQLLEPHTAYFPRARSPDIWVRSLRKKNRELINPLTVQKATGDGPASIPHPHREELYDYNASVKEWPF